MELTSNSSAIRKLDASDLLGAKRTTVRPLDPRGADDVPNVKPTPRTEHDEIVATAQKWVAGTFFGTLLKQLRDSPFKSDLFSGGQGGEKFGSLYDQQLADRMARGSGQKLVNAIARRIEAASAYAKQKAQTERRRPIDPAPANDQGRASDRWRQAREGDDAAASPFRNVRTRRVGTVD
jgi:Rod binding domain-containing protein